MVKSMTGFGREHVVANGREIIVEIRSVNHRYYEFTARTPRSYGYLDEKLKAFLKNGISRGTGYHSSIRLVRVYLITRTK